MPRYIDTDRLDEIVQDLNEHYEVPITRYEYKRISGVLCEFPTADVRENVHAKWVIEKEIVNGVLHSGQFCSNCGYPQYLTTKFCPNCGARMDERRDDGLD